MIEAFNPFTFKVIIDRYGPVAIYFVVLGSHLYNLSVFPVYYLGCLEDPEGSGGEGGGRGEWNVGIHVNPWLIHVNV